MRIILNINLFVVMCMTLISGSHQETSTDVPSLSMELRLVCNGLVSECVCTHGFEPCTGLYRITLDFSSGVPHSIECIKKDLVTNLIHRFQDLGVISNSDWMCESMYILKKKPDGDGFIYDDQCKRLMDATIDTIKKVQGESCLVLDVSLRSPDTF